MPDSEGLLRLACGVLAGVALGRLWRSVGEHRRLAEAHRDGHELGAAEAALRLAGLVQARREVSRVARTRDLERLPAAGPVDLPIPQGPPPLAYEGG